MEAGGRVLLCFQMGSGSLGPAASTQLPVLTSFPCLTLGISELATLGLVTL